jgi:uncharacterized protein
MQLQSLPLFPLGTVLFPGGVLPLRIFEVRYLDMIRRCIESGAPFGVVALREGAEVRTPGGGERFWDVGTLATIAQHSSPQPGLMVIRSLGQQRFRIERSELLKHGLWIADVERVPDDAAVAIPEDLRACTLALERLIVTLRAQGIRDDQLPMTTPLKLGDCAWVANRWCELLPLPLELKQRLMSLDNPLARLELVEDILTRQKIIGQAS